MKARERKLLAAWHSAIGSLLSILFLSIHARICPSIPAIRGPSKRRKRMILPPSSMYL
jgi:hypothetical protein